jgi:hypothetical protein
MYAVADVRVDSNPADEGGVFAPVKYRPICSDDELS